MNEDTKEGTQLLRIICRIRKPEEQEPLYKKTFNSKPLSTKSPMAARDTLSQYAFEKVRSNKFKYSIFTTVRESKIVLVSETPIPGEFIKSSLISQEDLPSFISSLGHTPTAYTFDSVINDNFSQEQVYVKNVRQMIQGMTRGVSATVLAYGGPESGKNYTIFGNPDTERGLVPRACNDLLSYMELAKEGKSHHNFSATVSIYHIYKDKIVDLIETTPASKLPLEVKQGKHNTPKTIQGLSEHPIKTSSDISRYLEKTNTQKRLQAVEEQKKELESQVHTIILLRLYDIKKTTKELISQTQFVKLACPDSLKDKNSKIQFEKLFYKLVKHSTGEPVESTDMLTKCLDLSVLPFCPVLFLACVCPGENKLEESVSSLQWASNMRKSLLQSYTPSERDFQEEDFPKQRKANSNDRKYRIEPPVHDNLQLMEEPIINMTI